MAKASMIEVKVWGLALDEKNKVPVVILQEAQGKRRLPIWIGTNEASAIAMEMDEKRFQRPLTHDLMAMILRGLKAVVTRVEVFDLRENTFYARILVERGAEILTVDARPSDSIALALRMRSPIYVASHLFSEDMEASLPEKAPQTEEEKAEELRRWLEDLNPKDFGKFQP
jgi:bifunctional DNase/RNase